jgi:DNA-binding MarR family transcriptional regulator
MSIDTLVNNAAPEEDSGAKLEALKALPPLTERQGQCLKHILEFFIEHRYYPTQREVAAAMGLQSSTVESYLEPLRRKGYLARKVKRQRRNIRLTSKARQKLGLEKVEEKRHPAA